MQSKYQIINSNPGISDNDKYYWGYQYKLGEDVLVPYLQKLNAFKQGDTVTEIGCAEGGVLAAFVQAGANNALGTDISQPRLDTGERIAEIGQMPIKFMNHDIITQEPDRSWIQSSDLVILRDVIEHLDDTALALRNIRKIIKPGGFLFVTFPPYYSPFGGHQHTVFNTWGKLPYIHLLPDFLFHRMIASGRQNDIGEVKRLQTIRLTTTKFLEAARKENYEVFNEDYYLLRPVFKMKFGLPTVRLTPIKFLPLVKSLLSLEAAYVLRVKE